MRNNIFDLFMKKTKKILMDAPERSTERYKDEIALINKKFRLNRKECKIILNEIRKDYPKNKNKRMRKERIKSFENWVS